MIARCRLREKHFSRFGIEDLSGLSFGSECDPVAVRAEGDRRDAADIVHSRSEGQQLTPRCALPGADQPAIPAHETLAIPAERHAGDLALRLEDPVVFGEQAEE